MKSLQQKVDHFITMVGMVSWVSPLHIKAVLANQPKIFLKLLRAAGFECDEFEAYRAEFHEKDGSVKIYNPHSTIRVWKAGRMNCHATSWLSEAICCVRENPEKAKSILLEEIKCRASNPDRIPPHFTEHQFYVLGSEPTLIAA